MKGIIDLYLEIPVLKICGFLYLTTEKEIPFYEIIIFFSSYKSKTKRIREKNWNFTRFLRHDERAPRRDEMMASLQALNTACKKA